VEPDHIRTAQAAGVVRDDERSIALGENVELEHVAAELDRERERLGRVLGRERRRAAMADAREAAGRTPQLDHTRRTTTTAQSSASSPRANERQSASTARASWAGGRSRRSARRRSRRWTPYSSPSRRASITPSV